jgi:hypothetical protein
MVWAYMMKVKLTVTAVLTLKILNAGVLGFSQAEDI